MKTWYTISIEQETERKIELQDIGVVRIYTKEQEYYSSKQDCCHVFIIRHHTLISMLVTPYLILFCWVLNLHL